MLGGAYAIRFRVVLSGGPFPGSSDDPAFAFSTTTQMPTSRGDEIDRARNNPASTLGLRKVGRVVVGTLLCEGVASADGLRQQQQWQNRF